MSPYEAVPEGSLDLHEANIMIGGVITNEYQALLEGASNFDFRGNKFVVIEQFSDVDGNPIKADQFDTKRMCYAMFVSPIPDKGRHRNVVNHHKTNPEIKFGQTVGGGMVRIPRENKLEVDGYSGDYESEPNFLREKFSAQLLQILSNAFDRTLEDSISTPRNNLYYKPNSTNKYWLRFSQVLDAAKQLLSDSQLREELGWYRSAEESKAKRSR